MRILLFLNSDIHSATALQLLSAALANHQTRIVLSQKVGNSDNLPAELLEMQKYERMEGKFWGESFSYDSVNSAAALQDFRNFAPDLMISIRFGQIFKPPLIAIPRYGVINLHSGILPDYRGVMASFWAILNKEKNLGTSLHYISDSGIDTGEIISFSKSTINWNESLILNINRLYQGGCELIAQALEKISRGEKITILNQKNLSAGRYFSYPNKAEIEKFLGLMPLAQEKDVRKILGLLALRQAQGDRFVRCFDRLSMTKSCHPEPVEGPPPKAISEP